MKKASITILFICFVITIFIKVGREHFWGGNWLADILLGSAPSFFFTSGIIFLIPIFIHPLNWRKFTTTSGFITFGAVMYEIEQFWTTRVFDINDLVATLLGFLFANLLYLIISNYFSLKTSVQHSC